MLASAVAYWGEPGATLLALLLLGHAVGDFVLQTEWLTERKPNSIPLMAVHILLVFLAHAVLVLPVWGPRMLPAIAVLAGLHAGSDTVKALVERRSHSALPPFVGDQVFHMLTLVVIWLWLCQGLGYHADHSASLHDWLPAIRRCSILIAGFILAVRGGGLFVARLLDDCRDRGVAADHISPHAGKVIGYIERSLFYVLFLLDQWIVVGFIVAAKSLGPLADRRGQKPDYYRMIGTLASLLVALGASLLVGSLQ